MTSRIILVALSIMVGACSTAVKSIKNDQVLKKDSGVFLTKLQTNHPFQMAIRNSKDEIIRLKNNSLDTKNSLLAMSLPAGKYSIHEISWKGNAVTFEKNKSYNFLIKNGKINYICDFGVYFKTKEKASDTMSANLDFVLPFYSKQPTYKEFKKSYPKIAKNYSLVSSPVSKCVRGQSAKAKELMRLLTKR